ncbi:MAG TPA: hypothetical protein VL084_03060 [Thermoanaerobaculia bacterium]|nr:hypothetical protein [Thermoanaerobaculia bacterium]
MIPSRARSCSICRCGDPTFNALGTDVFSAGAFRIAVDWDRMEKSQGPPEESESQVSNTVTATVSYSFGDRLNLVARVPYSFKSLTGAMDGVPETTDTHGLADPEFFAWFRLWASPLEAGIGRRTWVSVQVGVKTPWGQDDLTGPDGVRLDEHAQPGTGSTDVFAGLGGFYLLDVGSSLFGSAQYRWTGTNTYGYQYGRIFLANFGYERKLGPVVDAVLELNYRWAGEDTVDSSGEKDPDTGGSILYVTPRVLVNLGGGFVARASILIPTFRSLNGYQTEKAIASAGLTYSF